MSLLIISGKWTLSSLCLTIDLVRRSILGPQGAFYQNEMTSDGLHVLFIAVTNFIQKKNLTTYAERMFGVITIRTVFVLGLVP